VNILAQGLPGNSGFGRMPKQVGGIEKFLTFFQIVKIFVI